jgi:hypothetical protein
MSNYNLGGSFDWFIAKVVDVMDPHQSGRVKIRVYGQHDNITDIPDDALPWALPIQPVTSAASGRIGTAPVGLVFGSRVIGFWADQDQQYPIIFGSIGKSGDAFNGEFENGAPKINIKNGSVPISAVTGNEPKNPYSSLSHNRSLLEEINQGITDIFSVFNDTGSVITQDVEKKLVIPKAKTIGSADKGGSSNVLELSRQVDPYNTIFSLPCSPSILLQFLDLSRLITNAYRGLVKLAVRAAINAFLKLAKEVGVYKFLHMLNTAIQDLESTKNVLAALNQNLCGIKGLQGAFSVADEVLAQTVNELNNLFGYVYGVTVAIPQVIADAAFATIPAPIPINQATLDSAKPINIQSKPPGNYVPYYTGSNNDPFPGYIGYYDPLNPLADKVYVLRGNTPNYNSAKHHIEDAIHIDIGASFATPVLSGNLTSSHLKAGIDQAMQVAAFTAQAVNLGIGLAENPQAIEGIAAAAIADVINAIKTVETIANSLTALVTTTTGTPLSLLRKIAKIAKKIKAASHIGSQSKLAIKRQMFKASLGPLSV